MILLSLIIGTSLACSIGREDLVDVEVGIPSNDQDRRPLYILTEYILSRQCGIQFSEYSSLVHEKLNSELILVPPEKTLQRFFNAAKSSLYPRTGTEATQWEMVYDVVRDDVTTGDSGLCFWLNTELKRMQFSALSLDDCAIRLAIARARLGQRRPSDSKRLDSLQRNFVLARLKEDPSHTPTELLRLLEEEFRGNTCLKLKQIRELRKREIQKLNK